MTSKFLVKRVGVIGSTSMGTQIALDFLNSRFEVFLCDFKSSEKKPNQNIEDALKLSFSQDVKPLASKNLLECLETGNLDDNLEKIKTCDLIIEAKSDEHEVKESVFKKISGSLSGHTIIATASAKSPLESLTQELSEEQKTRFCSIHFFNPPRYTKLVEITPSKTMEKSILDGLEELLTTYLGKNVLKTKDTFNRVANRIGFFSLLSSVYHAQKLNLAFETVDSLAGPLIGRGKTAVFQSLDIMGLEKYAYEIKSMASNLKDDPWCEHFHLPDWLESIIQKRASGENQSKQGIYIRSPEELKVYDISLGTYRPIENSISDAVNDIFKFKSMSSRFKNMRLSSHPQVKFLWAIFRDVFHYSAYHLKDIAYCARDIDLALRFGFGWSLGPFEIWQSAGWQEMAQAISKDIQNKDTLSSAPLPEWVIDKDKTQIHIGNTSYSPSQDKYIQKSELPFYKKQYFYDDVIGSIPRTQKKTLWKNQDIILWTVDNEVGILSFKTKMCTITEAVLDGIIYSVSLAEHGLKALILWQPKPPFSAGVHLGDLLLLAKAQKFNEISHFVEKLQTASLALKYSQVPTLAAVQGLALGGGCELMMHCSKRIVHLETSAGLVEINVGLLPVGGGCKELAMTASKKAEGGDLMPFVKKYFENTMIANVTKSAYECYDFGFLSSKDLIVRHENELLYVAHIQAHALYNSGYKPKLREEKCRVLGKDGVATLKANLINRAQGRFISEYDYSIGGSIAIALCGGEVERESKATEEWLLLLERELFLSLIQSPETQARIEHMLNNSKPLRN